MKEIKLTKGYVAIVDDEDYYRLSKYKWRASSICRKSNTIYASTMVSINGKRVDIRMHRFIMAATNSLIQVDHKDGNGLNNQKCNLRLANNSQNNANKPPRKDNKIGYKGVCKDRSKYRAVVYHLDKKINVGSFNTPEEAALAYNKKAIEIHGEFAYLNKV